MKTSGNEENNKAFLRKLHDYTAINGIKVKMYLTTTAGINGVAELGRRIMILFMPLKQM